jgi:hypothetical protein
MPVELLLSVASPVAVLAAPLAFLRSAEAPVAVL